MMVHLIITLTILIYIIKISRYFPKSYNHFGGNVEVELTFP